MESSMFQPTEFYSEQTKSNVCINQEITMLESTMLQSTAFYAKPTVSDVSTTQGCIMMESSMSQSTEFSSSSTKTNDSTTKHQYFCLLNVIHSKFIQMLLRKHCDGIIDV